MEYVVAAIEFIKNLVNTSPALARAFTALQQAVYACTGAFFGGMIGGPFGGALGGAAGVCYGYMTAVTTNALLAMLAAMSAAAMVALIIRLCQGHLQEDIQTAAEFGLEMLGRLQDALLVVVSTASGAEQLIRDIQEIANRFN